MLNIPVGISTKFFPFGTFLLGDIDGSRVKNITYQYRDNPEQINTEILQEWLIGKGMQPVTWATLIMVLRDIELSTLAGNIEAVKYPASPFSKI